MPRQPSFPSFPKKAHKSGQARIRYRKRDYYLGVFGSDAARREYARLAAEFAADPAKAFPRPVQSSLLTVNEMVFKWVVDEGSGPGADHPSSEAWQVKAATRPLCRMFGDTIAADFDAEKLELLRDAMVACSWMNADELAERAKRKKLPGWSRNHVNHQITRIRKVFRWAEKRKHVPRGVWEHLRTVASLGKKSKARKNPKRKPVDEAVIEATLPHLSLMIAAMLRVQLATGMRPSELVEIRARDIDRSGAVWTIKLEEFKSDHLEDADEWQTVMLGPKAQAAITPWLDAAAALGPDTFLWRPRVSKPTHITTSGYYQAIVDGCKAAGVPRFVPYQIRHTTRHVVGREFGTNGAKAVLRHRTLETTRMYADQQDLETAKKIAAEMG